MTTTGRHFKPKAEDPQQPDRPQLQSNPQTQQSAQPQPRQPYRHAQQAQQPYRQAQQPQSARPSTSQSAPSQSRSRAVPPQPAHIGPMHAKPAVEAPAPASPYTRDRKPSRKRNIFPYILIGIGVVLLMVAAGLFIRAQLGYKQAADFYDGLEQTAVKDTDGNGVPSIDFDALREVSDDIVGWIYIPNTRINYVVAQGESNNTYLRHLPSGEYNENGTVFMDTDQTAPGVVEQQTTLYGHHMNDGSMFEFIDQTQQQDVFDTVEEVYYITDGTTYVFKPMFTMVVQDDYTDARIGTFESDEAFRQYLQTSLSEARASAEDASSMVESAEKVLTLVTCAGDVIPRTTRAGMVCTLVDSFEN